jgi:hypothetical protein
MENLINEAIKTAKLNYESDISWYYENTQHKDKVLIMFGIDENGKNDVNEFCVKHKGVWVSVLPTDEQIKKMFKMLNDTPYREVEKETCPNDDFSYYGHGYNGNYGL